MMFMSNQVKHHTSLCHIVPQNKINTMTNLAKLRERTVRTHVKVVRHLFHHTVAKLWNIENSK
jgi:hypothetical protein